MNQVTLKHENFEVIIEPTSNVVHKNALGFTIKKNGKQFNPVVETIHTHAGLKKISSFRSYFIVPHDRRYSLPTTLVEQMFAEHQKHFSSNIDITTVKTKTHAWLKNYPNELGTMFDNAVADGLFESINAITKEFALKEAEYLLKCFSECGHALNEGLTDEDAEVRKYYKSEKQKLIRYIERVRKSA